MNIIEQSQATEIRTAFTHFHCVEYNEHTYRRWHKIIHMKYPSDPTFIVRSSVKWSLILNKGAKDQCSKDLTAKEVKELGLEENFLKAKPELNI